MTSTHDPNAEATHPETAATATTSRGTATQLAEVSENHFEGNARTQIGNNHLSNHHITFGHSHHYYGRDSHIAPAVNPASRPTDSEFTPSNSPKDNLLDRQWLYRTYHHVAERYRVDLKACHCNQSSEIDDYLFGFVNTKAFHTWSKQLGDNRHQPLWVSIGANDGVREHTRLALCVLQQAIRNKVAEDCRIFTCSPLDGHHIALPEAYLAEKAQVIGGETTVDIEKLLLSLFFQLMKGGFVKYDDIACHSRPESLVEQFPTLLISALQKMRGRTYVVLDDLTHDIIDQVLGVISAVLETDDISQKCSFIISARASPRTLERREAYPFVESGTEINECLQSLQVPGADLRKDKIVDPAPESNSWVWEHQSLQDLMNSKSGALAIIGKAGSGKSVLAKTILQGLHKYLAQPDGSPGSPIVGEWFYCRRQGEDFTAYISLLKSIVSKFISKNRLLFEHCKEEYRRESTNLPRSWGEAELEGVLRSIIEDGTPLIVVVDAVDESDDKDDKIAKLIESLAGNSSSRTKTIFLSRHRQEFESDFWKSRQLILHKENDHAIQKVVEHGLVELKRIMYGTSMMLKRQSSNEPAE
ncbi:AAA ATPase domain-containing protein [Apiospora arundinis]|uniref:AAA ATPase domain-containing protein n=1 Tax=Apiospora arundinis TaxID=335852 RepID=A0ABR2J4E1_9PEZI